MSEDHPSIYIYFSDFFDLDREDIETYGAFNISLVNDLPLFIDPFLLFDSEDARYQQLHDQIIEYLKFLRDVSTDSTLTDVQIDQWFRFPEVKQNWLGFSKTGNSGSGLGKDFAKSLHRNLHHVFKDFGAEAITHGSHLEKLCLLGDGVGRDHLSDFVTNLIKGHLLEYTQEFARRFVRAEWRQSFAVSKVFFNYQTKRWRGASYELPTYNNDYVLLCPKDMLTKDDAWINRTDMLNQVTDIFDAVPDAQLRATMSDYLWSRLKEDASSREVREAAAATIEKFPILLDYFIRSKEDNADEAHHVSGLRVEESQRQFVDQVSTLVGELSRTDFYKEGESYEEALRRVHFLKNVIENNDGYRVFYLNGKPVNKEETLQIMYRLTWYATTLDVNREVNNGRGPVDFKVSRGSGSKTLVEFKLASNSHMRRNLEKQVKIYEVANETSLSITVIMFFNDAELARTQKILKDLGLTDKRNIVLIDASNDNKPSASIA